MSEQEISSVMLCGTCCIWPLAVWFGLNLLVMRDFRRRVFEILRGRAGRLGALPEI